MSLGNNNKEFSQAAVPVWSSTKAQIQLNSIYMSPIQIQSCPQI